MRHSAFALSCLLLLAAPAAAQAPIDRPLPPLLVSPGAERPVQLHAARIDVDVAGGQAQTTIELVLRNPGNRALEGQLAFPLQPGQEVSGFALDIDGRMHDAVPVPKQRGREVFEAIERRDVDPALLERTEGNYFRLRVFPVPAGGERRVRLQLVETLARVAGERRLSLPLDFAAGLAAVPLRVQGEPAKAGGEMGALAFDETSAGQSALLGPRQLKAAGGLVLRWPLAGGPQVQVQEHQGQRWFHVEVPLPGVAAPRPLPDHVGLLWDASGSAGERDQALEFALLDRYFAAVGDADVGLQVLRDRAGPVRRFRVRGGDWSALKAALRAEVADGATALGAWTVQANVQEYLLVGDGLANYGDTAVPTLAAGQRLYAISTAGARADSVRLRALAEARGGRLVELAAPADLARAEAELLRDGPRLRSIDATGARDVVAASVFPRGGVISLAGQLVAGGGELVLGLEEGGRVRELRLPLGEARARPGRFLAQAWAGYRLRELQAEPERNRTHIRQLGQEFGLATPETSLIVLETLDDYVLYDIPPPQALHEAFLARRRDLAAEERDAARVHLEELVAAFEEKQAWWRTDFSAGSSARARRNRSLPEPAAPRIAGEVPVPAPLEPTMPSSAFVGGDDSDVLETIEVTGSLLNMEDVADGEGSGAVIVLQPWAPDSDVARRLRAAPADQVYALYLDERPANAGSSAFFLDVADILLERGQRGLALRVLSNLAEMQLENRALLRVLGYRLMQANAAEQAVPVFRRVLEIAGEEPQSYRDLGLALDAVGRAQEAVDALRVVVERPWDGRFGGIALIALAELNAIARREQGRIDLGQLDPRLRHNLPLALRAVLSWDADNTDMDLWVTQPDGERCGYSNTRTAAGGRISEDFTGGYGPEEYSIRRAAPGKYRVEVDYFGDSQALVSGAVTVQVWLSADFGTSRQRDQRLTVRLAPDEDNLLVGEFEVR
ncbi:VIT domain-containing protein [Arenimonas soli]|nr:VIT domain-containing protein [Arenimonas soli]